MKSDEVTTEMLGRTKSGECRQKARKGGPNKKSAEGATTWGNFIRVMPDANGSKLQRIPHRISIANVWRVVAAPGLAGRANQDCDWLPRTTGLRSATVRDTVVTLDNLAVPRILNTIIVATMCIRAAPKRGRAPD